MEGNLDKVIFGKKTFGGLLEEIYTNSKTKEKQIAALISELRPLVQDIGDATMIVPLISSYMDLGIKNDEMLVKMATIVQRALNTASQSDSGEFMMTEAEKAQLMAELNNLK